MYQSWKVNTASKGDALLYNWEKESTKTTKEVDRKYKARYRHEKHTIWWKNEITYNL